MFLVDRLKFGPFTTAYHGDLIDDHFKYALQQYLDQELLTQSESPIIDAEGTITAKFNDERYCGAASLVRDIFTLEVVLVSDFGKSELKSDIVFDPSVRSFSSRVGHGHSFYLWTPKRKQARKLEMEAIQRRIDAVRCGSEVALECPICCGKILAINNADIFDVRCTERRCFQYSYHKDERGRLTHGHFFTRPPET